MLCTAIKSEFGSDLKIIEPGDGRSCNTTVTARLFDHDRPTVRVKSFLEGGTETTETPIWQRKELGAWQIQFVLDIRILCEQRLDELSLADSPVRPKIRRDACEHDSDNQEPSTVSSRFHSDSQLDPVSKPSAREHPTATILPSGVPCSAVHGRHPCPFPKHASLQFRSCLDRASSQGSCADQAPGSTSLAAMRKRPKPLLSFLTTARR